MCRSTVEGGQRCASHTRPAFESAAPGTVEWDAAAAQYASCPTGRADLEAMLAETNDVLGREPSNIEAVARSAALESALRRGMDAAQAARDTRDVIRRATPSRSTGSAGAPRLSLAPPVVAFDEVFHVGDLDPSGRKAESYEGSGLSISIHPDEWARIARLGSPSRWQVTRPDGSPLKFAAWHDVPDADRDSLRQWAAEQGWVEERKVYQVSWFDDELDDTMTTDFTDRDDAEAEADAMDVDVETVTVWRATTAFPEGRIPSNVDPTDALLAVWVRQQRPDLDGVWWDDTYNPAALSCPRGVLVHSLESYSVAETAHAHG